MLSSCNPSINFSKYRKYNYFNNGEIGNNKLGIQLKSFGDIEYSKRKRNIKKAVKQSGYEKIGNILFYGKTEMPSYIFFITDGGKKYGEN